MEIYLIILISYLCGSIPFGLILTKIFLSKDIREHGSGNIGATNVLRIGNKLLASLTLILDLLKALIPILYIKNNFYEYTFISSLAVFIGHVFPIWIKFKGGKGVATFLGILFALNYILAIIFIIIWLLTLSIFKYSSLSSIISTLSIPIAVYFFNNEKDIFFYIILFVLILFNHRENIKRLKNKEEKKINLF